MGFDVTAVKNVLDGYTGTTFNKGKAISLSDLQNKLGADSSVFKAVKSYSGTDGNADDVSLSDLQHMLKQVDGEENKKLSKEEANELKLAQGDGDSQTASEIYGEEQDSSKKTAIQSFLTSLTNQLAANKTSSTTTNPFANDSNVKKDDKGYYVTVTSWNSSRDHKYDCLWDIAKNEYGDANKWKNLASTNKIADPTKLKTGEKIYLDASDASIDSDPTEVDIDKIASDLPADSTKKSDEDTKTKKEDTKELKDKASKGIEKVNGDIHADGTLFFPQTLKDRLNKYLSQATDDQLKDIASLTSKLGDKDSQYYDDANVAKLRDIASGLKNRSEGKDETANELQYIKTYDKNAKGSELLDDANKKKLNDKINSYYTATDADMAKVNEKINKFNLYLRTQTGNINTLSVDDVFNKLDEIMKDDN